MTENANKPPSAEVTPGLGIPVLTLDQVQRLTTSEDRGISPAQGIRRFPAFEDWVQQGGIKHRDNFHRRFSYSNFGELYRELQCFQRYAILHPSELEDLMSITRELFEKPENIPPKVDESIDRKYWVAYEKLAGLVDASDAMINNGKSLPPGQAIPDFLTG